MTYQYVKPTEEQLNTMQIYRDKFEQLVKEIDLDQGIRTGRGLALAKTKLEEAAMWLNKAITLND